MATNAKFKVEIYGDTAKFENSLKGVNSAMSSLKGEARILKKALDLDPTNKTKMQAYYKNLQEQMRVSEDRAKKLKEEINSLDKGKADYGKKFSNLNAQLGKATNESTMLKGEIEKVENALETGNWKAKVDIETGGAEEKVSKVGKSFSVLKEVAVGALRTIGSNMVSALGNGLRGWVSDAMDTQKAMISLKNTMQFKGNAGEFDMVSKAMSKLAKDTNANTEDTLKLSTTFIGLGDDAKTAVSKTEALVKANQAFGGTGENLKGVVQAYGQMSAAGKVTAENINQLTDNNTALGSALKSTVMEMNPALKQYGSFAGASEKGAISVEMLDKAMQKLGQAGGGAVTTIGDAWDSFNETLSLALLPTLDALTPVISSIIDKMSGWGEVAGDVLSEIVRYMQFLWESISDSGALDMLAGGFKALGSTLGSIVNIIKNVLVSFGILPEKAITADSSIEAITESVLQLAGKFEAIMISIANFTKKISESETAMTILKATLVVVAGAMAGFKVAKGILATIQAFKTMVSIVKNVSIVIKALYALILANPFVAIAVAIGAVVAGLVYFFTSTKTGKKVWADFVDFLKSTWESIVSLFNGIGKWFSDLWTDTVDGAKGIWQGLVSWFGGVVQGIQNTWNGITTFFTNLWTTVVTGIQTAWNGVTSFFTTLFNGIKTVITTVFTGIQTVVTTAYNWFVTTFQPLISFYQSIFNLILSVINLAFQTILAIIRGAYTLVINAWQGLVGWWNGIFSTVQSVVLNAMNAVAGFAQSAWNKIVSVWNAVAGFFSGVFNSAKTIVSQAFNAIGLFAQSAWSRIVSIWNAVAGFFSGIFNSAKNVVNSAFSAIGNFASNAWNRVRSAFSPVASFFSSTFNSARNVVSGVFNAFGNIASGGVRGITGAFGGLVKFFSSIFGSIGRIVDNVLGGVTRTIDSISGAINGVAGKISKLLNSNMVQTLPDINLASRGSMMMNSATVNSTNNSNVFNIDGSQDAVAVARQVVRLIETGRA